MLPEWMKQTDNYVPPKDGGTFAIKTIKAIGNVMSRLKVQAGHEKKRHIPALVKLIGLFVMIVITSACQNRIVILAIAAVILAYLCMTVFYNGRKGKHPTLAKWFFYGFYPAHYLIIWIVSVYISHK